MKPEDILGTYPYPSPIGQGELQTVPLFHRQSRPTLVDHQRGHAPKDTRGIVNGMEWDLSDLYLSPEDPNLERDLAEALNLASNLDPKDLLHPRQAEGLFRRYEEALEKAYKPLNYASLYFATRTQDPVAKALLDRVRNRYTEVRNRLVPLEVALRKLPEEAFQALLEHPGLADLRHFLQRQRAFAPHTLSEREEELLNLKGLVGDFPKRAALVVPAEPGATAAREEMAAPAETAETAAARPCWPLGVSSALAER